MTVIKSGGTHVLAAVNVMGDQVHDTFPVSSVAIMTAQVDISGTTFADVTGLSFACDDPPYGSYDLYWIEADLIFTMGATNQGIKLGVAGSPVPTSMVVTPALHWRAPSAANTIQERTTAAVDTGTAVATSLTGLNTAKMYGYVKVEGGSGTFRLRAACDAAISTLSILPGSRMMWCQVYGADEVRFQV